MSTTRESTARAPSAMRVLSKVPEVTILFWIIKVLCTTVGETAADFLNTNLHLGLTGTTVVMSTLLAAVLVAQFRLRSYVPGVYWLAVVLISVVGTLITDNLVDNLSVSLVACTAAFSVALAATFLFWFRSERTLSIHSITTLRREAFYWLAILFTFALGTAAGDLVAEKLSLGYWKSAWLFVALIAVIAAADHRKLVKSVPAFWAAYILTRPLGASIGDYLSQARVNGGLGLGTVVTSGLFLGSILLIVVYLTTVDKARAALATARRQ